MVIWVCPAKKKDDIPDCYAIIADEVTDRFSDKEMLLLCLRYVRSCGNEKPFICQTLFDSLHIQGRPTGQTIEKQHFAIASKKWNRPF